MAEAQRKYLCDAVAAVDDQKLFVTVYRVNDGIDFQSGRGEMKHGSPHRQWTPEIIKHEIALVYGASKVEISRPPEPQADSARRRSR
jgi:hypothetical protein